MPSIKVGCRIMTTFAVVLAAECAGATPAGRTLEKDPIELIAGRDTPGKPELAIVHEGIEYRFTTTENKARFEKEPSAYEVADGGACGRMGPLAGMGDARRYAVHDGRIYFFASDGCREGFLKDPTAYIESAGEKAFGTHEQVLQGRSTLDKVVAWAGGAERLRGLATFRASAARTEKQGDKDWRVTNETFVSFPRCYYQREAWNESWFSTASCAEGGVMASAQGAERIATSRASAFERSMARWPVVILKAHVDGAPGADCPGLVVIGDGEGEFEGTPVEFVKVWLNGAASRMTVEKDTGRPRALSFHGRDGSMRVGEVVRTFTADKTEAGIRLPTAYAVTLDGKENPPAAASIDGFEVNPPAPAGLFVVPPWGEGGNP